MTQYSGETGEALAAARDALAAQDRALGAADRALNELIGAAYRSAVESVRRIEAVQSAVDELGADGEIDARSRSRLLLDRNHELIDIVTAARDAAATKTIELQRLNAAAFSTH